MLHRNAEGKVVVTDLANKGVSIKTTTTSWRYGQLCEVLSARSIFGAEAEEGKSPSSSSRTWSNPTFCPRECFALDPHTMALSEC